MAKAKAAVAKEPTAKKSNKSEGTPLSAKLKTRLKEANIEADTEEEAREKMVTIFKKQGLGDMEGDSLTDLIDMVTAFPAGEIEETEEEEKPVKAAKGATKKKPIVEEEDEPSEEDLEYDETDDGIAEEAESEDIEEAEEEDTAPPVKKGKKAAPVKSKKKAEPEEDEEDADAEADALVDEVDSKDISTKKKATDKPEKKVKKQKSSRVRKLQGTHWEDLTDQQKEKALKPIKKLIDEKEIRIELLHRSFALKFMGKTGEHNIAKYHLLRMLEDGKLEGVFISNKFKEPEELQEYLPESDSFILRKGDGCSYAQPFHQDLLVEMFADTDFLKESVARCSKQDTKMKVNRDKLEAQLKGKEKPGVKVTEKVVPAKTKKVAPPVEEEDEEEDEAPTPPVKKAGKVVKIEAAATKKPIAKATAKKK